MPGSLDQLFHIPDAEFDPGRTLAVEAYHQLRADIIEGVLKPGEKLKTEHLKDRYNVGAATLREALALLTADALVISQHQRGFRVAPMSLTDFRDITHAEVRQAEVLLNNRPRACLGFRTPNEVFFEKTPPAGCD